jgi:hypothetical protein
MASEPGREPRSSPTLPDPLSARIALVVFMGCATFCLICAGFGLLGLVSSLVSGRFPRGLADQLILALGGGFFFAFLLGFVRDVYALAKRDRRAWRLAAGRCPRCGYDIRNLPDRRCPECGETWSAEETEE